MISYISYSTKQFLTCTTIACIIGYSRKAVMPSTIRGNAKESNRNTPIYWKYLNTKHSLKYCLSPLRPILRSECNLVQQLWAYGPPLGIAHSPPFFFAKHGEHAFWQDHSSLPCATGPSQKKLTCLRMFKHKRCHWAEAAILPIGTWIATPVTLHTFSTLDYNTFIPNSCYAGCYSVLRSCCAWKIL